MNKSKSSKKDTEQCVIPVVSGMCVFNVIAKRNYYGEIQEKQVQIEGETLDRAKFYFNTSSLFWRV